MPEPSPEAVEALFQQAADLGPGERRAFLDEQCAGDPELRAAVDDLLRFDAEAESDPDFLPSPAASVRATLPLPAEPGLPLLSAAIASWAGTAKVAWVSSTRPNKTTHAAPLPSR